MNIWVEFWKVPTTEIGSHAQMKEQTKWIDPDPKDIIRRYFDKSEDATEFSKKMNNKGYHAIIKRDGVG